MERRGKGRLRNRAGAGGPRGRAGALAALTVAQALLPLLLLVSVAPAASATTITTDELGRSSFDIPADGLPHGFNVSVPSTAVATSFRIGVSTPDGQAPPDVPSSVAVDLGGDGADWSFGGGEEGAVGRQSAMDGGDTTRACSVGVAPCGFSFTVPAGARIDSAAFDVHPRPNVTLWSSPDYVSVIVGVAAVPLNLSSASSVTMADLERDGVPELVAAGGSGGLRVFTRVGTQGMLFNESVGAFNASLSAGRTLLHPQVADMTGDEAPDIVVGTADGNVTLFVRLYGTGGPPYEFAEDTSFFAGVSVPANATPALADLDNDGDLDIVVGSAGGDVLMWRNDISNGSLVKWQIVSTFLPANLTTGPESAPAISDLDGDGDLDVTVGQADGSMVLLENIGDAWSPQFRSLGAMAGASAPSRATPSHALIDGDLVPDVVFGSGGGLVYYSLARGGLPANVTASVDGVAAALPVAQGQMSAPARVSLSAAQLLQLSGASLPVSFDSWGNVLHRARVEFSATHFGDIIVTNLSVAYGVDFTLPDLASPFRRFAAAATPEGNRIVVPVTVTAPGAPGASGAEVTVSFISVILDSVPGFIEPPFLSLDEDTADLHLLDLRSIVTDEDPASLTFAIVSNTNDTFATASITDGAYLGVDVATGDYNDNWTGFVDVVVRATDVLGQSLVSPPIRVVVRQVPDAPVIEAIFRQYLRPDEPLRYQAKAIDSDPGDTISFTLISPTPATATVDWQTGLIYWNPTSAERALGIAHFSVVATDGILQDVQLFDVVMLASSDPVFGSPLPRVEVLPGRPEFLNLYDFATGDTGEVLSVSIPQHPYVNLSEDGRWIVFDYPSNYAPGTDQVAVNISTLQRNETSRIDIEIIARPAGLFVAPFPPTPIGRGVAQRIELLRYTYQVAEFSNLSFSVDNPLAAVSGYNLTILAPQDYPGQSLTVTVTAHAGNETASAKWRVNLQRAGEVPRLSRMPVIAGAVRSVDLAWALPQFGIGQGRGPLGTDSVNFTAAGGSVFASTYREWPAAVEARDFWPVERIRVLDERDVPVLEVETAYDGRSRYVDRVQYFREDAPSLIDTTFTAKPELAGGRVHNVSVLGTGPVNASVVHDIERIGGGQGRGSTVTFVRDTHLEQLSVVAISEGGGTDSTVSWPIWAVVTPNDDAPVFVGSVQNVEVDLDHSVTVDLGELFWDEEGDDLLFQLSQAGEGVSLDRSTGWLRVDGVEGLNLSGVRVIASEARNQSLFAASGPFVIRIHTASEGEPGANPSGTGDTIWDDPMVLIGLLVTGMAGAAGLTVYFWTRRNAAAAAPQVDEETWEAVMASRPPPTPPPVPDDPAMVALDEEWSRVIASRHTDGATPAEETEADLESGVRSRARGSAAEPEPAGAPEEPRKPQMSSSDTETERRAGDTESEAPWARRRLKRR